MYTWKKALKIVAALTCAAAVLVGFNSMKIHALEGETETLREIRPEENENIMLVPGGVPFGIRFQIKGVLVVSISDVVTEEGKVSPGTVAGLKQNDVIEMINGEQINSVEDVNRAVQDSNGEGLVLTVIRAGDKFELTLTPVASMPNGNFRAGVWLKDSATGIGTMTFFNPYDNSFGGLGHGVVDVDTGELLPLMQGIVTEVRINGITRGLRGAPGVIKGQISSDARGYLTGNHETGVFGFLHNSPTGLPQEAIPIATRDEVTEGTAHIWTTLCNDGAKQYEINIARVNRDSGTIKNFVIQVTDPDLLERTGGIVQGMSGSPIIQNGKLIGAVTHVMVNDPTSGYGIFIENMLDSMSQSITENSEDDIHEDNHNSEIIDDNAA